MEQDIQSETSSTVDDQITVLSEALETAEKLDSQLQSLYMTFDELLTECKETKARLRSRRAQLEENIQMDKPRGFSRSLIKRGGRPYFRDSCDYSCPYNEDVQRLKHHHIPDFYRFKRSSLWNTEQKKKLLDVMLKVSRVKQAEAVIVKINSITRSVKNKTKKLDSEIGEELKQLKKSLKEIEISPLESVALPLEKSDEYDWMGVSIDANVNHSDLECRSMWKISLHPAINRSTWTVDEVLHFHKILKEHGNQNWNLIAKKLGTNRSAFHCFLYYKHFIYSSSSVGLKWTKEEDAFLKNVVENLRIGDYIPWSKVSAYIEGRSKIQIYNRYLRLRGRIHKGVFTEEEDAVIIAAMKLYGRKIRKIMQFLPVRSFSQIAYRVSRLVTIKRNVWSISEDVHLFKLIGSGQPNYFEISKQFIGKSWTSVKYRHLTLKKWLNANPDKSVLDFQKHTKTSLLANLDTAIKKLKYSVEKGRKPKKKINYKPQLKVIDAHLLSYFKNVHSKNVSTQNTSIPMLTNDVSDVRAILQLLGANLNVDKLASVQSEAPETANIIRRLLLENKTEATPRPTAIKTYSRKKVSNNCTLDNSKIKTVDIWNNEEQKIRYYLPPFNDSLIGLQYLTLFQYSKQQNLEMTFEEMPSPSCIAKNNLWNKRMNSIFFMPTLLSTVWPNIKSNLFNDQTEVSSKVVDDLLEGSNLNQTCNVERPLMVPSKRKLRLERTKSNTKRKTAANQKENEK